MNMPLPGFQYRCECGSAKCLYGDVPFTVIGVGNAAGTTLGVVVIEFPEGHAHEGIAIMDAKDWHRAKLRAVNPKGKAKPEVGEPVAEFARECLESRGFAAVTADSVYLAYMFWAGRSKKPPMTYDDFVATLRREVGFSTVGGTREYAVYPGLRIRPEWANGVPQRKDAEDDGA